MQQSENGKQMFRNSVDFIVRLDDQDKILEHCMKFECAVSFRKVAPSRFWTEEMFKFAAKAPSLAKDDPRFIAAAKRAERYLYATVSAWQPEDKPRLLALWTDGTITTFATSFEWTKDEAENFDPKRCDECGVKHSRKNVFIIQLVDGRRIQVGGQCAGNLDCEVRAKNLFKALEACIKELRDDSWGGEADMSSAPDVDFALRIAYVLIRRYGYVSKAAVQYDDLDMSATSANVSYHYHWKYSSLMKKAEVEFHDALVKEVFEDSPLDVREQVLAWIEAQEKENGWSEFLHNCKQVIMREKLQFGLIAFLASAIIGEKSKRKPKIERALNLAPGKTQDIPGVWTILRKHLTDSQWGSSYAITAVDDEGNGVSFFSSSRDFNDLRQLDRVSFRAQVDGVNEFKGVKTRVLKRVQVTLVEKAKRDPHDEGDDE